MQKYFFAVKQKYKFAYTINIAQAEFVPITANNRHWRRKSQT